MGGCSVYEQIGPFAGGRQNDRTPESGAAGLTVPQPGKSRFAPFDPAICQAVERLGSRYWAGPSVFVAWFTYDIERPDESISAMFGDAGHRWLTAQGIYHTYTATLDLYNTSGLFFLTNPDDPLTEAYGTMSLRFSDCGKGTIYYDIPSVDHNSTVPIVRLTEDSQRFCEQLLGDSQHRSSVFTPD